MLKEKIIGTLWCLVTPFVFACLLELVRPVDVDGLLIIWAACGILGMAGVWVTYPQAAGLWDRLIPTAAVLFTACFYSLLVGTSAVKNFDGTSPFWGALFWGVIGAGIVWFYTPAGQIRPSTSATCRCRP